LVLVFELGFAPPAGGFVRTCPEFNSGMTATISVILNLIQNQLDPVRQLADRQDDSYGQPAIMKQNFFLIFNFLISAPTRRGEFPISIYHFHT